MIHLDDKLLEHIRLGRDNEALSLLKKNNKHFCPRCSHLNEDKKSTLLQQAAEYGNTNIAQHLINLGTDVNAQNSSGETALMLAVQNYHQPMIQLLLQANADVLITDKNGECILKKVHRSTDGKMFIIRNELLKAITPKSLNKSKYVKSKAFHADYPLYHIIPLENHELTKALIKKGSPVDVMDPNTKKTALHLAVQSLDLGLVKLLIKYGANVNATDYRLRKPLSCIKNYNNSKAQKIMKILIEAGTKLFDNSSSTKLVKSALLKGNAEVIKAVLQTDLDLYTKTRSNGVLIDYLLNNVNPEVFEIIKNLNIDFNRCSTTLLHGAVSKNNETLIKYLLERGVNVNAKDYYGRTPLCTAIEPIYNKVSMTDVVNNRLNIIEILLDYGADPQIITKENVFYTPAFSLPFFNDDTIKIQGPIIAQLVLDEANGREIDPFMRSRVEKQQYFRGASNELLSMKEIEICESFSLFDFLVTKVLSILVENEILISNLRKQMEKCDNYLYYHRTLQVRFAKLDKMVAINEIFVKFYNFSVTNVAQKIINYL